MSKRAPQAPIVLATGGTGGHVFPAQAVAMELEARGRRLVERLGQHGGKRLRLGREFMECTTRLYFLWQFRANGSSHWDRF